MTAENVILTDPSFSVVNETGDSNLDVVQVLRAGREQSAEFASMFPDREFAEIVKWTSDTRGGAGRSRRGSMFDRDRFVSPDGVFDKMRVAELAIADDVVAGFLESSEGLVLSRIGLECSDEDEQDIWDQICDGIDLEARMKEVWRELCIYSMSYVAVWFGTKSFKVRGKSDATGTQRKKTFNNLTVPLGVTTLDPFKVIPVGNYLFNQETLTYYADPTERDVIDSWLLGDDDSGADDIIKRLIVAKYEPDFRDRKEIGNLGIDPNRLYMMNPKYVWRLTATKSGWKRFPEIRMESIFELLDLKNQLRQMDRANLIGASNFILLIKKGTDTMPAKPYEIGALQDQVRTLAKVPVIVGDHRLSIEIITPATDTTLDPARYEGLDARISGRLWGMFIGTVKDDSVKLTKVVARGLESRRNSQRDVFYNNIFLPTYELNASLKAEPKLVFHPKSIMLDFDPSRATYLLDLFDRGNISRASVLSEVDYDEGDEAAKKRVEKAKYDAIFAPPALPAPPAAAPEAVPGTKGLPVPKQVPRRTVTPPGSVTDPKRAGRALGGNRGKGGNGNIGRGAGLPPKVAPKPPNKNGGKVVVQRKSPSAQQKKAA